MSDLQRNPYKLCLVKYELDINFILKTDYF